MTVGANSFTERKEAGTALIEACRGIIGVGPDKVGAYKGFEVSISFDTFSKEYKCHLILYGNGTRCFFHGGQSQTKSSYRNAADRRRI